MYVIYLHRHHYEPPVRAPDVRSLPPALGALSDTRRNRAAGRGAAAVGEPASGARFAFRRRASTSRSTPLARQTCASGTEPCRPPGRRLQHTRPRGPGFDSALGHVGWGR